MNGCVTLRRLKKQSVHLSACWNRQTARQKLLAIISNFSWQKLEKNVHFGEWFLAIGQLEVLDLISISVI